MDSPIMYDRQVELIDVPSAPIHIIGCGGVGTWAAIFLALAGEQSLYLYDDDVIEESNLNRLPYPKGAVGKSKTELLAKMLRKLRPGIELTLRGKFQPLLHRFQPSSDVICAVDTMSDRHVVYTACRESGAYYVDVGAEQHTCTVSRSPADWSIVQDQAGYFTPVWVAPVVMAAAMAVSAVVYRNLGSEGSLLLDMARPERLDATRLQEVSNEQEE